MNIIDGNEFEALKMRFENQVEQLHRMTLIDLRVFSGFITLQLALGAWLATKGTGVFGCLSKFGVFAIDLSLAVVAVALLYNNLQRRKEVAKTVGNCATALGYKEVGKYMEGTALDANFIFRPWAGWYYLGICTSLLGVVLVIVDAS